MNYLTEKEYQELCLSDKYWVGRWDYFSKVIEIVKELNVKTVLELGAYKQTLVKDCDVMDKNPNYQNVTYHWNATKTPFPIEDKKYDLFIALQVWEHLYENNKEVTGGRQKESFAEVMRISRYAILSFPYKWNVPNNVHDAIDEAVINEWTLGVKPIKTFLVGKRIIYLFDFGY